MAAKGSIRHLLAQRAERTARAEEEAAQARELAARSEVRAARLEALVNQDGKRRGRRGPAGPGSVAPDKQHEAQPRLSRAAFLGKAGAVVAGVAGAALLEARSTQTAYASTDTNFVATGIAGGGGTGFAAAFAAGFARGVDASASSIGVSGGSPSGTGVSGASSSGTGVYGLSTDGGGVLGASANGVGGFFQGGRAPISLVPAATAGPPTGGNHNTGDVWVDNNQAAWICVSNGIPGMFVPLLEGNVTNPIAAATTLLANAGFASGTAVLTANANQAANATSSIQGVQGSAAGAGIGVYGTGISGDGVFGQSTSGAGVSGTSFSGVGGVFGGGRAPITLNPAVVLGPPTTGAHNSGDIWLDNGANAWICRVPGTPGYFVPLQQGGLGNALFTAVSTLQYHLANSDGVTWVDLDTSSGTPLKLGITVPFNCQAVISGNADLWTANGGYNQDLGIAISGGVYPTTAGQPEAWKESGGFAGTPNAAFVQTLVPLVAGTAYTIKLQWKANRPASGATIYAGAGPIGGKFSPTRLTALLVLAA